jgi:hypothetical protein
MLLQSIISASLETLEDFFNGSFNLTVALCMSNGRQMSKWFYDTSIGTATRGARCGS